jgi:hypothetical protein
MRLFTSSLLFLLAVATTAFAAPVPEIDPGTGVQALVLLGGAGIVVRSWRRK